MHIGNRLFPYPVLNSDKLYSQFKKGSFHLSYSENVTDEYFILDNIMCELTNDYLLKLINDGKTQIVCIIECASTNFRAPYILQPNKMEKIFVSLFDLGGKYSVSAYLIAKENFEYYSDDFYDDYDGYIFQIEKNDILAIDDGFVNVFSNEEKDDNKNSSIYVVIKDKNITNETMQIEYDYDKITISLPEKQWNIYDKMKRLKQYQNMYFSIMAVPALGYSLSCLQNNESCNSIDDLRINFKWFSTFLDSYKKFYNQELNEEDFLNKRINVYTESQVMLGSPVTKAIDTLFDLIIAPGGDNDED